MSKVNGDDLQNAVADMLATKDSRKFVQTVDLFIRLKNYQLSKAKRFSGAVRLPYPVKPNIRVCVLGDARDCDRAEKAGFDFKSEDDLKSLNKNKKLVKKLANQYDAFLASSTIIKKIPGLLGPGLSRAGKFPTVLAPSDDIQEKTNEIHCTIKFQLKKEVVLATAVGHVGLGQDQLVANITLAVNFLVSLLVKGWQNVGWVSVKSTMGKPHSVYP
uniref:Ribosomal protein n=1 Tax=Percolomonas cosmopolitus TaxID=63605 RepID=A0A7S1PFG0_9EUKA